VDLSGAIFYHILRADADEKLHQRVTVRNMSTYIFNVYHIFKAYWCNFSSAKK